MFIVIIIVISIRNTKKNVRINLSSSRFGSDDPFPLRGVYQVFASRINISRPDVILAVVL